MARGPRSLQEEVWTGLAHIGSLPENDRLDGRPGAYTNVLAPARSAREFTMRARAALAEDGFEVREIENVEPVRARARRVELDVDFLAVAADVELHRRVAWTTVHAYLEDED